MRPVKPAIAFLLIVCSWTYGAGSSVAYRLIRDGHTCLRDDTPV
jgi:hypothetical protein